LHLTSIRRLLGQGSSVIALSLELRVGLGSFPLSSNVDKFLFNNNHLLPFNS
jgi:hypothetical protein